MSDSAPGSDESLYELYRVVRVAEEFDLAEEAAAERAAKQWDERMRASGARDIFDEGEADSPDVDEDAGGEPDAEPLTLGQLLGMLEHVLGASEVEETLEPNGRIDGPLPPAQCHTQPVSEAGDPTDHRGWVRVVELLRFYNDTAARCDRDRAELAKRKDTPYGQTCEFEFSLGRLRGMEALLEQPGPLMMLWSTDSAGLLTPDFIASGSRAIDRMRIAFYRADGELADPSVFRRRLFEAAAGRHVLQVEVTPVGGAALPEDTIVEFRVLSIDDVGAGERALTATGRTSDSNRAVHIEVGADVAISISWDK